MEKSIGGWRLRRTG